MNQPTEERFKRIEEEQKHLREEQEEIKKRIEQKTEPIPITRIEVASEDVSKRLDSAQEDTNILKIEMAGARADILQIRESQADLRDSLKEHGQHLEAIRTQQERNTETLGNLLNLAESHDSLLKNTATKDDIAPMATKDDVNSRFDKVEGDVAELKGLIMQLLQQKSGE